MKNQIKKIITTAVVTLGLLLATPSVANASAGTMSFFGGISEGLRMPTVMNRLADPSLNGRRNIAGTYAYSEMVFLSGNPSLFEGTLTVGQSGQITDADMGTFTLTNVIEPSAATGETAIWREIAFSVEWRRQGTQVLKNYNVTAWDEFIETPEGTFFLDVEQSHFVMSILEDHNPGAVFYRGNISKRAVFINDFDEAIVVETTGIIYGFDSPYSSTETQRLDVWVMAPDWQMSYQVRPSVSVTTYLQYQENTLLPISFVGNYMHFMENRSVAAYDIFIVPQPFHFIETSGSFNIESHRTFEQLIAPDLTFLRGHFAEQDVSRLFAQQILTGQPTHFQPSQLMTRGEFITALVRALRIELPTIQATGINIFNRATRVVFPDVPPTRPEYRYIMAAYRSGLAYGRTDGNFHVDAPLSREEAVAIMIRGMGLNNVAMNPTPVTAFADSLSISSWATRDIAAALELGLIESDANGNFHPRAIISKAEGAALINRFIDYMREDLVRDYSERMINFTW